MLPTPSRKEGTVRRAPRGPARTPWPRAWATRTTAALQAVTGSRATSGPAAYGVSGSQSQGPDRTGVVRGLGMLLRSSCFDTWSPRGRTHLLCLACAALFTLFSMMSMHPLGSRAIPYELAGGVGLALLSTCPLVGSAVELLAACGFCVTMVTDEPVGIALVLGPWLCASVLLTRGFNRLAAYGLVVMTIVVLFLSLRLAGTENYTEVPFMVYLVGAAFLIGAELIRRPREQADTVAARYQADLERQRLLVVSELHDTVVRDLTRAVMTAEQARLAHPGQSPLADELGAMTLAVRTAVEQLRSSLRAMNDAGGGGLDVLASSAPRPLEESLVQAVQVLAGRGTVLEVHGLEFLERQEVSPGVRQQLVRVLNELVSNMTKYAAASSTARLELDSDGHSLEAMVTNAVAEDVADGREAVLSSGLGLEGARRRVEALGGTLSASGGAGRWTVVLSVPLQAQ